MESKTSEKSANKSVRFSEETDRKFSLLAEKLGRSKQDLFGQMVDYFYKSKKDPADLNDEVLKKEISQGINRIISFIKTQEKESLVPILAEVREGNREASKTTQEQVEEWNKFIKQFSSLYKYDPQNNTFRGVIYLLHKEGNFRGEQLSELAQVVGQITQALTDFRSESSKGLEKELTEIKNFHSETSKALGDQMTFLKALRLDIAKSFDEVSKYRESQRESFRLLLELYMDEREKMNAFTKQEKIKELQKDFLARIEKL